MASATFAATAMAPNGVASQFRERGIEYRVSDQAKNDIYKC